MKTFEIKRRKHIALGYKAHTGKTLTCQAHLDSYNLIQDKINTYIDAGIDIPENWLNASHRQFVMMATV